MLAPPKSMPNVPRQFRFVIRCYAQRRGDQWQAFSLELGLAAQADTLLEVKRKLEIMIGCYVHDAVAGEDRDHAYELLSRRAPWWAYVQYGLCAAASVKALEHRKFSGRVWAVMHERHGLLPIG